jgi:hypothetical protein
MSMRAPYLLAVLAAISLGPVARADSYIWSFGGGGGSGSTGNSLSFNSSPSGGPSVTATAWYITGGLLQPAALGQYSPGLGVCNAGESCVIPHHQVDNFGQLEFILFQFSEPLSDISFTINPSPDSHFLYNGNTDGSGDDNVPDRDVTFWAGNPALGGSLLTGQSYATIGTLFGVASGDIFNDAGGGSLLVNLGFAGNVNAVLFGALDTLGGTPYKDFFKVSGMAGETTEVPEPSSILLLGTALTAVGFVLRKRVGRS